MKKALFFVCLLLSLSSLNTHDETEPNRHWSQFRGYLASGWLDNANLPVSWNIDKNENVLWNIEIPGLGLSCPVIWEDKLFITTAISAADKEGLKTGIYGDIASVDNDSEHEWKVYCINKNTGAVIWDKIACTGIPEQKRHSKSSHANSTAATDGNYVIAFFGSEGLYCYDMDGNLIWKKDFGVLRSTFFRVESAEWEFASSPIIYDGKVVIQCDVMEDSFLTLFDIKTGNEIWKMNRDEYPGWCTPNIYKTDGNLRIAVNGYKHRGGYDFETGEEVWRMSGGGDIQVPTPIVGDGLIYFNSAHGPQSPILAIQKNAEGDITLNDGETTNSFVKWSYPRGGSYMQTMLLYDEYLYNLGWNGRIECYDPITGETIYKEKIGKSKSFIASLVASDGHLFAASDQGDVYVIKSGKDFEVVGTNKLKDICMVTPGITAGIIFFRTQSGLIALSKQ